MISGGHAAEIDSLGASLSQGTQFCNWDPTNLADGDFCSGGVCDECGAGCMVFASGQSSVSDCMNYWNTNYAGDDVLDTDGTDIADKFNTINMFSSGTCVMYYSDPAGGNCANDADYVANHVMMTSDTAQLFTWDASTLSGGGGGGGNGGICVEVGQRVQMHDGTHKNVENLVPGDVLRTPDGVTTVRSTRRSGRHLSEVHDVSCNGMTGSITGNHAYHCEGEWRMPQETHKPRALTGTTEVVAVETDNYCEDRMVLESGLHVETWDGRGIEEWRPHSYENGRRLRCTLKGTWRDRVLKRVDSKQ